MTSSRNLLILVAICLLALAPAAMAGTPRFTTIDYPGAAATTALGVNPAGDIVGIYYNAAGAVPQSYLIHNGAVSWFSFPGSKATQAWDISPTGAVVGFHKDATNRIHGFVMEQGVMTSFDVPGSTQTRAFGINAGGDIVGYYVESGTVHGFLLSGNGNQ
jgi:uncharacterized membrane protein